MKEIDALKNELMKIGELCYRKGFAFSGSGNLSIRVDEDSFLVTPTKSALGFLEHDSITHISSDNRVISGDKASKEYKLHRLFYQVLGCKAVLHVHSTNLTAVSCLQDVNRDSVFPPITPYLLMKFGDVPLIPYYNPGDEGILAEIEKILVTRKLRALLVQNHGIFVASFSSIRDAFFDLEELEESAKLFLLLRKERINLISEENINKIYNIGS